MPDSPETEITPSKPSRSLRWLNMVLASLSLLLLVFIGTCYFKQFDDCAAITVYPSWVWTLFGVAPLLIAFNKQQKRLTLGMFCLWLLYLTLFADAPVSLVRGITNRHWHEVSFQPQQGQGIRVVTLNCSSSPQPVLALKKYDADIILLQESCGAKQLQSISQKFYGEEGSSVAGIDASIIVHGEMTALQQTGNYLIAKATLHNGVEVGIISLRLTTPPLRGDLWNRECWEIYKTNRIKQRKELQEIIQELSHLPASIPIIIGGDFNAPPQSTIFREFPKEYQDAFRVAGVGWGNSIINDFPFLRIDQLWSNRLLKPVRASSVIATDTDHRLVVADFSINRQNLRSEL